MFYSELQFQSEFLNFYYDLVLLINRRSQNHKNPQKCPGKITGPFRQMLPPKSSFPLQQK